MALRLKRRLGQSEIKAIPYLMRDYPQILISPDILSPSDYLKYFINSIHYFLRQNKKSYLLVAKNKKISGMALLRFMEWDTRFFKMPTSCIEYILIDERQKKQAPDEIERTQKELLRSSCKLAKKLGIKILYISINSNRHSLINTLNSLGFNFICAEMERVAKKNNIPYIAMAKKPDDRYKFRKYKEEDYLQVIKIAKEISKDVNSKFSLTPYLPQKEKENYYLESIKNCCLGINADEIFVVVKNRIVVGFVCYRYDRIFKETLRKKMSFLVIGGIAKSERRRNIGAHLFTWAHKQIFKNSEVIMGKVYLHNLPMIKFTLRKGLIPSIDFIYTFCKKL